MSKYLPIIVFSTGLLMLVLSLILYYFGLVTQSGLIGVFIVLFFLVVNLK